EYLAFIAILVDSDVVMIQMIRGNIISNGRQTRNEAKLGLSNKEKNKDVD
ncbi:MAG: hypothetical protein EZS28_042770, partial [Streblomastix strix]